MAKKVSKKESYYFRAPARKQSSRQRRGFYFVCPNHGRIPRDEVIFLCNTCGPGELTLKGGIYLCPQCFEVGENFQCRLCDSSKVEMRSRRSSASAKGK